MQTKGRDKINCCKPFATQTSIACPDFIHQILQILAELTGTLSREPCDRVVATTSMCEGRPCLTNSSQAHMLEMTWSHVRLILMAGCTCIVGWPMLGKHLPIMTSNRVVMTSGRVMQWMTDGRVMRRANNGQVMRRETNG